MTFAGYVPVRRGFLEHLYDGRLTCHEGLTLLTLIMLADKETGRGLINAPVLRTYIPGLSRDGAKRVLSSLEAKGYIFRKITSRSPLLYPYWVNRYIPTAGRYKSLQLDLTKALESRAVEDIRYGTPAPDGAPDTAPESAPEGAHYNKTGEKKTEKEDPYVGRGATHSMCSEQCSEGETGLSSEAHTLGQGCDPPMLTRGAHKGLSGDSDGDSVAPTMVIQNAPDPSGVGLRWTERGFVEARAKSARCLSYETVCERIAPLGLVWREGSFFTISGVSVPWGEAIERITGQPTKGLEK